MTPDQLREAVWRAIMSSDTNTEAADAAIAIVLEQAARVADEHDAFERKCFVEAKEEEEEIYDRGAYVARNIAAAIRAMATASSRLEHDNDQI